MRRIPLLLAALAALPLSLYAAPAAAQSAANAQAAAAATSAAIGAITTTPPASQRPRAIQQFTTGWRFLQADAAGAEKVAFDDSAWKSVTLPHDWSIAGPAKEDAPSKGAGAFMPTGVGWYRKSFTVPAADAKPAAARRTFVVFDGVMANSDVYLNGELLGHRPYGYVSFVYELTPHLRAGKNVIAVRVDDSQQPASRWYPGAGINRQVRLVTTGDAHIVPWGTFVTTPAVTADSATIHIRSTVTNESAAAAKLSLRVQLTAPNGSAVLAGKAAQLEQPLVLAPGATADLNAETSIASGSFSYNPDDEISSESYDANGNVLSAGGVVYTYDSENHMTSATGNGKVVTMVYDAFGNRVSKTVNGVTTQYLVEDNVNPTGLPQVVEELVNGTVTRQYMYGLQRISENQLIANVWTPSFYGYDGGGSVRQLTNSVGVVTDTYEYDAFGNSFTKSGTTPNNYLYRGEQFDADLGLYYLRARYYNPQTGRFLSRDPEDGNPTDPKSLHKYLYAGGDPVNMIDPMGREAEIEYKVTIIPGGSALGPSDYVISKTGLAVALCFAGLADSLYGIYTHQSFHTYAGGTMSVLGCWLTFSPPGPIT